MVCVWLCVRVFMRVREMWCVCGCVRVYLCVYLSIYLSIYICPTYLTIYLHNPHAGGANVSSSSYGMYPPPRIYISA